MLLTHDSEYWDHVVGIDPGETTGFCAIKLGPGSTLPARIREGVVLRGQVRVGQDRALGAGGPWWYQEARTCRNIAGRLASLAGRWDVEECLHLAIEDFILREQSKERNLLAPVRITSGILSLLEEDIAINVTCHFHQAGDAKTTVTDAVLKKLGVYEPGQGHANDAARHAILTLRKNLEFLRRQE